MASSGSSKKRGRVVDTVEGAVDGVVDGAPASSKSRVAAEESAGAGVGSGAGAAEVPHIMVAPSVPNGHWFQMVNGMKGVDSKDYSRFFVCRREVRRTEELSRVGVEAAKRLYLDRFAASKMTNVKRAGTPGTLAFLTFMHQLGRLVMVPYMGPEDAKYDTIGIYAAVLQPGLSSKRFGVHNMPTAADLAWTNWDSKLSVTENIKTSKNLALPSMVVAALDIKSFPEVPELDEKASVERKLYAAKNPGDLEQRIVLSTVEFNRNARSAFVDPVCKACFKFLFDVYFRQPFMGPCCSLLQKFHGSRKKTSRFGPVSGEEYNYGPNFLATYVQLFMSLPLKRASGEPGLREREYDGLDLPEFLELAFNPFPVFGCTSNMEASIECGFREGCLAS